VKVLVPFAPVADSFTENVVVTLRAMGHNVVTSASAPRWDVEPFWKRAARVLAERTAGARPTGEERRILKLAKAFKPDMVLALTMGLNREILHELGKICPGRRVLWWGDPPANNQRWGMLDAGWDLIYVKDASAVTKLRLAGRNAYLLHEAMNPMWHKVVASQANDTIAVAGNSYAFRQAVCVRLMECKVPVALYGPEPPVWSDPAYRKAHIGKYIVREEKSRVFGEALACLNTFSLAEANSLNCRAFEIAGAGGLQLIENRPVIEQCFEPGKELLTFSIFDELMAHIQRARKEPAAMNAIREAGARRALAEHTYQHRLGIILNAVVQ
jgi:spore maturation protein CgeB